MAKQWLEAVTLFELVDRIVVDGDYNNPQNRCGCIYAFEVGDHLVKIGRTQKPQRRLRSWRTLLDTMDIPTGHSLVTIPHLDAKTTERKLHAAFGGRRASKNNMEFFAASLNAVKEEISKFGLRGPTLAEMQTTRKELARQNEVMVEAYHAILARGLQNGTITAAGLELLVNNRRSNRNP